MIRLARSPWPWLLVLLAVTAALYSLGRAGGYAFDDYPNIVQNEALHVTSLQASQWIAATFSSMSSELQRPLAMLTFAVNCYFTGLDPQPMKLTNIGIHLVNILLVFGLVRALLRTAVERHRLDDDPGMLALAVTSLWALAPINLMAVLFIVQRMESLCHTFVFAGLWLYTVGRQRQLSGRPGHWPILIGLGPFTLVGLLSKESAALLPLYALGIEVCLFHFKDGAGRRSRPLLAMFAVGVALPALVGGYWLLQHSLQAGAFASRNYDMAERLLTEPRVLVDYLHWTLLPDPNALSLYHDDYVVSRSLWQPGSTLPAILAIAALLVVAWALRSRRPLASLGLLWFLSAQALTATFVPLELVFEHRNYFASLGVMLALADVMLLLPHRQWRRVGWIATVLMLALYGTVTGFRAWEWSNPLRFALAEVASHPSSPRAAYHLGQTYVIAAGESKDSPFTAAAIAAFERARTVPNGNILPAQGLLLLSARTGRPLKAEWWQEIDDRLSRDPIGPQERSAIAALTNCATIKKCRFDPNDMSRMFAAALSRGNDPEVINIYAAYSLNVLDQPELALGLWKIAADLNPHEAVYRSSVIKLLLALGRYDEAQQQVEVLRKMGKLGQYDRTIAGFEERIRNERKP